MWERAIKEDEEEEEGEGESNLQDGGGRGTWPPPLLRDEKTMRIRTHQKENTYYATKVTTITLFLRAHGVKLFKM